MVQTEALVEVVEGLALVVEEMVHLVKVLKAQLDLILMEVVEVVLPKMVIQML